MTETHCPVCGKHEPFKLRWHVAQEHLYQRGQWYSGLYRCWCGMHTDSLMKMVKHLHHEGGVHAHLLETALT